MTELVNAKTRNARLRKRLAEYIGGDRARPLVARLMECCETVAFTGKKGG